MVHDNVSTYTAVVDVLPAIADWNFLNERDFVGHDAHNNSVFVAFVFATSLRG
jgi:hypothetical protein